MTLTVGCTTRPYANLAFADTCKSIAAAGYTDIAVFSNVGLTPSSPREKALEVRRTAEDAGLVPSLIVAQVHVERDDAEEDYKRLIDHAVTLGASWILDMGTSETALLDAYVALMRTAASYAQSVGLKISTKPHGGITTTTEDLVAVWQRVNHPAYGICYDPGNIIYYTKGAEMPETNIAAVAPMATTGIIKDCILRDGQPDVMITPGDGLVNFESVLRGLANGGFRGPLYVECLGGTALDEIERNAKLTREYIEGILDRLPA